MDSVTVYYMFLGMNGLEQFMMQEYTHIHIKIDKGINCALYNCLFMLNTIVQQKCYPKQL